MKPLTFCSVDGCIREHRALGYCNKHYKAWERTGSPFGLFALGFEQSVGQCSVAGCSRELVGLGYCRPHYKKFRRYGDPLAKAPKKPPQSCEVVGCENPSLAKGWCQMHYARMRIYNAFELPARQPKFGPLCQASTCQKPAHSRGLCHMHYRRLWGHGMLELPIPLPHLPAPCQAQDCQEPAVGKGLCQLHYNRQRRQLLSQDRPVRMPKSGRKATRVNGRHRKRAQVIMEQILGRPLESHEIVHHTDENPSNDAPENLEVMTQSDHARLHNLKRHAHLGNTDTHQRCPACHVSKPREEFRGQSRCIPCQLAYQREWYAKHGRKKA